MSLVFDAATHTYSFKGRPVPGVTSILSAVQDGTWWNELARERGQMVHLLTEAFDNDEEVPEIVNIWRDYPEELDGYLDAWKSFREATSLAIEETEVRIHHPTYDYAGTADRIGIIYQGKKHWRTLIDLKTGAPSPWHPLQVAAYAAAWNQAHPDDEVDSTMNVYLKDDGTYRNTIEHLTAHTYKESFEAFIALLRVKRWAERHNISIGVTRNG